MCVCDVWRMASAAEKMVEVQRRMMEELKGEKMCLQDEVAEMRAKASTDSSRPAGEQGDACSAEQSPADGG